MSVTKYTSASGLHLTEWQSPLGSLAAIRSVSALEVSRNCALQINIYLLILLTDDMIDIRLLV